LEVYKQIQPAVGQMMCCLALVDKEHTHTHTI
jgi:hypothetical protein